MIEEKYSFPSRIPLPKVDDTVENVEKQISSFLGQKRKYLSQELINEMEMAQKKLESYASWNEEALKSYYLSIRRPLQLSNHYFYLLDDDPRPEVTMLERSYALIGGIIHFINQLTHGELPQEISRGVLLDKSQYEESFFSTIRRPGIEKDQLIGHDYRNYSYFILMVGGHCFQINFDFNFIDPIYNSLGKAVEYAKAHPLLPHNSVGIGTSLAREQWAQLREESLINDKNRITLDIIEKALFVVALDYSTKTKTLDDALSNIRDGHCENRYFDKPIQLVVMEDGIAGFLFEHSAIDGHTSMSFASSIYTQSLTRLPSSTPYIDEDEMRPLYWSFPLPFQPHLNFENLRKTQTIKVERLDGVSLAPAYLDGLVQLSLQLACFEIWGKVLSMNEAVQVRHFHKGRYATIFSCSEELLRFIHEWPRLSHQKLDTALKAHKELIKKVKSEVGAVSHFSALLSEIPRGEELFGSEVESWLNCKVTTTNVGGQKGVQVVGYSDALEGVLGIAYLIFATHFVFHIKGDQAFFDRVDLLARKVQDSLLTLQKMML